MKKSMSKSTDGMRNFLHHIDEYAKGIKTTYSDGEISTLLFMDNVADKEKTVLKETKA